MIKHRNSYYEIILVILTLFSGVAFLQDSQTVKVFTAFFILALYLVKEIFLYLENQHEEDYQTKLQALKNNEVKKELEDLRNEINNINIAMFKR